MARIGVFCCIATAALVAAPPSFAQERSDARIHERSPAAAVATVNWTGPYVGGSLGGVFSSARHTNPGIGIPDTSIGSIQVNRPAYSVYGGFNYQFTPWTVVGVEYTHTWLSGITYREFGPTIDQFDSSSRIDALTARVGFLLRSDTMLYGKVGPARIGVRYFEGFSTTLQSKTLDGIQGGVGVETMVTPNLTLRAEATYTRAQQLLSLNQDTSVFRPVFVMFSIGAAYKFDAPEGWGTPAPLTPATWPAIDDVFRHDPAVVAPRWTGLEAGGFVSFNGNKIHSTDSQPPNTVSNFTDQDIGGGAFVGANLQLQRFVVGVEASWNREAASFNTSAPSGGLVAATPHFASINSVTAFTGRFGFLVTPGTLLYVKGGAARLHLNTDYAYFNGIAPNVTGPKTFSGPEFGFGAETYILPRLSVRVEGLYMKTSDSVTFNGTVPNEFSLKPSFVSATLGVALHL